MIPPKKILYVITKSNFGGAQRYVFELATSFPQEDFEVVVAAGGSGLLHEKLQGAGIRTVPIHSFERDINILKEIAAMFELSRLIREERPDVVHLNSSKAGGSGAFIARLHGVTSIIFTAHGWPFFEKRSFFWRALAWFFSWLTVLLAHKVIVVSKHDREKTRMPFVSGKFSLIHTALPSIEFKSREVAQTKLFSEADITRHMKDLWMVTNAELNHNKNLFIAVDAVIAWNKNNEQKIFYSIVSDGELKESLAAHIKKNNGEEYIRLLGYIPNAREYLKSFDLFILPSKKEGMPYALLEAGAAGLFCIASDVGGIPELIRHKESGFLINPEKVETIIQAFEEYIQNTERCQEMAAQLQKNIMTGFGLNEMVEKTKAAYR